MKITLPSNLENGNYKVWLHNGHGGQYGWSSSLDLTVNNQCDNIWSDTTITVASNTQEAILNAIHQASDYDTIYLPAGTYNITSTVNLCVGYPAPANQQKALRFVGEGDGSQVKIVNQIKGTTEGSLFYITKLPSEFVNITFEENVTIFQGDDNKAVLPSKFLYVNPYRNKEKGYSNSGFRLNNCRFIQHRLITFSYPTGEDAEYDALLEKYNNPDAEDSRYCEGDWMDDMRIRKAQYTSYISSYAAPVAISSAENVEITNCYFEGAQAVTTRGCLNVNVSNNTMMGKAIMYGNSGSNFMHTTHTDNIDISNNNIYGKDLITDPNGDLEEGDLTLCRTLVIQLPSGSSTNSYFADNDINRIGDNASNSGEHIMYECLGLHFMDKPASVSGVGGITVTFNNTVWENRQEIYTTGTYDNWYTTTYSRSGSGTSATDSSSSSYMGDAYAVITDGRGESQYRKITGFTTNSFTVDRPWDIVPDSTSTIAIVNAVENTVVYRNTIIGSNSFYLKYNASAGVQAYATMLDYIASENNFSNLYTGFFCNSHFNNKRLTAGKEGRGTYYSDIQSSGFNWFEDTLIYNNVITNTRRAVDVKLSYSADSDILDSSDILTVSHGAVVRSNTINTTRYGYNYNSSGVNTLEGIGGEGIAVGSLDKDYTVWGYNPLCPGDWLKDTLIENNDISDTVKSYIGLQYHQSNTVLRNNYCEGITDEKRMVWYNPLRSEIHPDVENAILFSITQGCMNTGTAGC